MLTDADLMEQARKRDARAVELGPRICGSHGARWYCAQTHPQMERRALYHLSAQKFRVWLPQIATGPMDRTVIKVMFPCYLFVQFDASHDNWRPICSTRGVRRLFGSHPERPTPVREGEIERLMSRGRAGDGVYDDRVVQPSLVGQKLRLTTGPFTDFDGICAKSSDERVSVMVTMFGREVEVAALRSDVEIAR